jgi:hypothetical protein
MESVPVIKKAVGIVDLSGGKNKKFIDSLVTNMHGMKAIVDDMLLNSATHGMLKEVFRFNEDMMSQEKFNSPIEINESHVRHFFSKMQKGQHAVQNYRGYKVNTPTELMEFFTIKVGKKAFGEFWLENDFMEVFEGYPQGVYTVSDCNVTQSTQLKSLLGGDFAIVLIGQEGDVSDDSIPRDAYVEAKAEPTKEQMKEITGNLLTQLKTIWEKGGQSDNNQPTAGSIVRSRFNEAGRIGEQDTVRENTEG